jgi:predicted DNA-binding protein
MPKAIQIPRVPDEVHERLRLLASQSGMTLGDYLRRELRRIAGYLTLDDLLEESSKRPPIELREPIEDTIREGRDAR